MPNQKEHVVDELRHYLTLQLEAYHAHDEALYSQLESKIIEVESRL